MKKIVKILGSALLVVILLMFLIPVLFQGKIEQAAREQLNQNLLASVDFSKVTLSLFKGFPNAYFALHDLSVLGEEPFEGDTLVAFKTFSVKADLFALIGGNLNIRSILLDKPVVKAAVLDDGKANWDIVPQDEDQDEEQDDEQIEEIDQEDAAPEMNIELKSFKIVDASISYEDRESGLFAELKDFDFSMSGDMAKNMTNLDIHTTIQKMNIVYGGIRYMRDVSFLFKAIINADMENMAFTIKENELGFNNLLMGLNGSVKMDEENIKTDILFDTKEASFKSLLSLVPAIYMRDFQDLEASGDFDITAEIKGIYNENRMPDATLSFNVGNGAFSYPDLPKSVENVNVNLNVDYNGADMDQSVVNMEEFHVEFGGNPVDFMMKMKTPESDPQINAALNANVDFATFADIIPLDDTEIKGGLKSNISMMGRLSSIENEDYDAFDARGQFALNDFFFSGPETPQDVSIPEMLLVFSSSKVDLTRFNMQMGRSDFKMKGSIQHFIGYTFSDDTLSGDFVFVSELLNANELMPEAEEDTALEEPAEADTATTQLSVVEVPGNIDFKLTTQIDHLVYDNLDIRNVLGVVIIRNSAINMKNLDMELLEGRLKMNGQYDVADPSNPMVDFGMRMEKIDIPKAFQAFNTVQKLAPVAENATGKFSMDINFTSYLDQQMQPVYNSMVGDGTFTSEKVVVKNSKTFEKISNKLKTDKFRNMALKDLSVDFEIKDGRVYFEPFETSMNNVDMTISGDQGIDKTMNYLINMRVPAEELSGAAGSAAAAMLGGAMGLDEVKAFNIGAVVKGTFDNPKVQLDMKQGQSSAKDVVKENVKKKAEEEINKVKDKVDQKAKGQADKILREAEQQAERIRINAEKAADIVREEADDKADKLVSSANNPIAKRAAKESAKKIRKEAGQKAQKIEAEGDQKANLVMEEAQKKADQLLD